MDYKRLTERKEDRYWQDEELWTSTKEPDIEEIDSRYCRLAELEDKIEDGTLIKLPCKVGDKIFVVPSEKNFKINEICNERRNRVYEFEIEQILINRYGYALASFVSGVPYFFNYDSTKPQCINVETERFYKETWFLTREEAEAKLKELKEQK